MTRPNDFPRKVRIAAVKRATRDGLLYCEGCNLPIRGGDFRVDHIIAAGLDGKATLENASVLCRYCYLPKDAADNAVVKRATKVEAAHLGVPDKPKGRKMQSRGFPPRPTKPSRCGPTSKTLPRKPL
jgi:5-methylcytosine-specific restriction endonuclease McrA